MSQTNDDPQTITVQCSPIDFEKARDDLEARGYTMTTCTTHQGYLELTGTRKRCECDLCREKEQQGQ